MKNIVRLTRGIWEHKLVVFMGFFTMFINVLFELIIPYQMTTIVDEALPSGDMRLLRNTAIIMLLVAFGALIASLINNYCAQWISQTVSARMRNKLFTKIQSLSMKNIDEFRTGRLITNCTNDVTQVRMFIMMLFRIISRAPLMLIGGLIMAIYTSKELANIFWFLLPLLLVILIIIINKAFPLFEKVQKKLDGVNTVVHENVNSPRVVKSFVNMEFEEKRFNVENDGYREIATKANRIFATLFPAIMIVTNIGFAGIMFLGAKLIENGTLVSIIDGVQVPNAGVIIAFFSYTMNIMFALIMAAMVMVFLSRAEVSAKRINEVLDAKVDLLNPEDSVQSDIKGNIIFDNVSFGYSNEGNQVLNNISFKITAGEKVGIIGSTGSGKSTLVNLIPRLYDVTKGKLLIDGVSVSNYDIETLRNSIGLVTQKPHVFSGNFITNIRQGRETSSLGDIKEASKIALAEEYILDKDDKYEEAVNQGGSNLSGGQKQRLSLARALVRKPKILILDDSTSALDANSEQTVMEGIEDNFSDSTVLIISQKVSTIIDADKIIVLDNYGNLDGFGDHYTLLKTSKVYKEIYDSQYGIGGVYNG
ncbi:ABC transporter ATP-binding protein [Mycoplasmatota bacterium]|nr:ABC transporter ATP-binding protein [Mycoplasmatota bacterium]